MADRFYMEARDGEVPLVSIVIPTFNRAHMLCDAVESCLKQTWPDVEVIVIDDGSTDDTEQLVAGRMAGSWPEGRVRYLRQPNRGASAARNLGLQLARGAYVQFLDSDDLLLPGKIAKQIAILEGPHNSETACCYCYGTTGVVTDEGTWAGSTRIGVRETNPDDLVRVLCSRVVHGMPTPAPLWRRSHLMEHAGWREDIALGDDLEYHIRLLVDAKNICFIEEELFFVREHTGPRLGATSVSASSLASLILTRQAIFDSVQQRGLWDSGTQRAFLGAMRTIYANALQLGDKKTIRNLENWLWALSSSPRRMTGFQSIILARRLLGRRFLLGAHRLLSNPSLN